MSEGEIFVDDYKLINCVATGTYSHVWEVSEKGGGTSYAMKLLLSEAFQERDQIGVLKHEAKVAKSLEHPNLIRCHKCVVTKKHAYMIMDYFRSQNIKAQIGGDLAGVRARIRKLVEGVTLALGYMHEQGWVHKDLKPDNILLNKASEVRIIDFSLSMRIGALAKMMAGSKKKRVIQGTRTYIAPETLRRELPTPRTDIYSLGVTLFEVLTGEPPFRGSSPDDLLKRHLAEKPPVPSGMNPNVTPEMDRFVLRMLSKKPKDRHKDMHEVFAEFRSLKPFKEDPQERAERLKEEARLKHLDSLDQAHRLDSRSDALKSELGRTGSPASAGKSTKPKPPPKPARTPPPRQPQPQPAPQQPGYYGPAGPQPAAGSPYGPPQYYPPNYPYPQTAYGTPAPPGGMPAPQQAGYPGGPPPGWYWQGGPPVSGQQPPSGQHPVPGQQPPPQQPPSDQPPPPPPSTDQQQTQAHESVSPPPSGAPQPDDPSPPTPDKSTERPDDDDLPYMEELPEVI